MLDQFTIIHVKDLYASHVFDHVAALSGIQGFQQPTVRTLTACLLLFPHPTEICVDKPRLRLYRMSDL